MPIRKFDRIFVDGRYTGQHACTVECDMCGKQICFDTFYSFGGLHHPPEVEQNGFVKAITPDGYVYICKDHVKGYDHINTNYWKGKNMRNLSKLPRWTATITYRHDDGPKDDVHMIEELFELQDIVECGPDFYAIESIKITINTSDTCPAVTVEQAQRR